MVLPMCVAPMTIGAHAVARAASTRPNRPAPNSAASLAAMTTTRAARQRRDDPDGAVGLTPSTSVVLVSSGTSGGWST